MTVSNAEDKSRRMRTDEKDRALVAPSDSVTVRGVRLSVVSSPEARQIRVKEVVL